MSKEVLKRINISKRENSETLDLSYLGLEECPEFPPTIKVLYLSGNYLKILKTLPPGLTDLIVDNNRLIKLPDLPESLEFLSCEFNNLGKLPNLPGSLEFLDCTYNNILISPKVSEDCELYYNPQKKTLPITEISLNAKDEETYTTLESGNALINFEDEATHNRFHIKQSFNRLDPKISPSTRKPITDKVLSIAKINITKKASNNTSLALLDPAVISKPNRSKKNAVHHKR